MQNFRNPLNRLKYYSDPHFWMRLNPGLHEPRLETVDCPGKIMRRVACHSLGPWLPLEQDFSKDLRLSTSDLAIVALLNRGIR